MPCAAVLRADAGLLLLPSDLWLAEVVEAWSKSPRGGSGSLGTKGGSLTGA